MNRALVFSLACAALSIATCIVTAREPPPDSTELARGILDTVAAQQRWNEFRKHVIPHNSDCDNASWGRP